MHTSSKSCPACAAMMKEQIREHFQQVGPYRVHDRTTFGWKCPSCGEEETTFDQALRYEQRAAALVLREVPDAGGGIIRFARKALELKQEELACLLDVRPETISRWERDHEPCSRVYRAAIISYLEDAALDLRDIKQALAATQEGRAHRSPEELEVPQPRAAAC